MISATSPFSLNIPGIARYASAGSATSSEKTDSPDAAKSANTSAAEKKPAAAKAASGEFSADELREITTLKNTDSKVRSHEAAHMAAAGGLSHSGASYEYTTGPDGKRYAVGGEVSIDTSSGRTPEETLRKAEQIRGAALAPADPSGQDLQVAAQAAQMAMRARAEIAAESFAQAKAKSADSAYKSAADNFASSNKPRLSVEA
ncbi:putative metalloprotease CJM1_0395 family protein [Niveibacterium terrae]|uniref:putative metalloprotease CJM1_0395 family protein n=1 Tax=Niveibacterium terrae TaxID=3373598 RepID=UPI003A9057E2